MQEIRNTLACLFLASIFSACANTQFRRDHQEKAMARYDSRALSTFIDGVVDDMNGDWNEAIAHYHETLKYEPSSVTVYVSLAQEYYQIGRLDKAQFYVDKALELDRQNVEGLELLADIHFSRHDFDLTVSTLERVVRLDPLNSGAHHKLISLYELQGKPADAVNHYETLLKLNGPSSLISLKLGDYFLKNKDYVKATTVLKNGRDADPNNVYLIEALGQSYALDRQYAKAIEAYEDLYRLEDNNAILVRIGNLAIQAGDYARAADQLEKADSVLPHNGDIQRSLGFAYSQTGRNDLAIERLEKAILFNPLDVISMSILAPIYEEKKRFGRSDSLYESILIAEPDNDLILNNYSYSLAVRGVRLDHALNMIRKAINKAPDNSHYLDTMGWVHFQMANYKDALHYVEKSYALDSGSWEVADHLGDIHAKLNDRLKAVDFWRKALELNPNQSTIRAKIESVR